MNIQSQLRSYPLHLQLQQSRQINFHDHQTRALLQNKMLLLRDLNIRPPSSVSHYHPIRSVEVKNMQPTKRMASLRHLCIQRENSHAKILTLKEIKKANKEHEKAQQQQALNRKKSNKLLVTLSSRSRETLQINTQIKQSIFTRPKNKVRAYKEMARKLQTYK